MKSRKGEITWDQIVKLILVVVAVLVIGLIIFASSDKSTSVIGSIGRMLRFG
jgi:hypothetical protein